ncbi:sensor histidine kinase [Paenibacillus thalictri]|uniref:HAMP domain-containing protein n=1 Tax=Paenibacillus thalictri TaxID=2527873 RepID=A0A4Q9DT04_9BACL|nr:histidine kinase [Paenibacillus thalictri]TBL79105.1 HAMP domain-containing protein [Paenibacillus thalictri]
MKFVQLFGGSRPVIKNTLSLKIIMTFLLVIIFATSIISIIFYVQATKYINSQNELHNRNVAKSISKGIDQYIEDMDRLSKIIIGNPELQRILLEGQAPDYLPEQKLKDFDYITNLVLSFTSIRDSIRINIYTQNKSLFYTGLLSSYDFGTNLDSVKWFAENERTIDTTGSLIIPPQESSVSQPTPIFGMIRALKKIETNEVVGYITVTSSIRQLNNLIYDNNVFTDGANIDIVDERNHVLNSVHMLKNETRTESVRQTSELTGWTTVISIPSSYSRNGLMNVQSVNSFFMWICSLVIVGTFAIAILLSRHLMKPINHFVKAMRLVRNGNFDISLNEKGLDFEMRQLYSGFNTMILEIKKLIHHLSDEKLLAKTAQLEALQFQITPHFLYNTLQTMEAFGEIKDVPEIQTMAQSLGKLFRYNIHGSRTVHLYEELELIQTYFNIERIRFRDKIVCQIEIDDPLRHCMVLKFVLQPIVENCILHGFKHINYQGRVLITGQIVNERLMIRIQDNGKGMSHERLTYINERLQQLRSSDQPAKHDGFVGVFNVHRRLVSFYGPEFGLQFKHGEQSGTVAELAIPVHID